MEAERAREVMREKAAHSFEKWNIETQCTDVERARQFVAFLLVAVTHLHGQDENAYVKQILTRAIGTDQMDATVSALTQAYVPEMTDMWHDTVRRRRDSRVAGRR